MGERSVLSGPPGWRLPAVAFGLPWVRRRREGRTEVIFEDEDLRISAMRGDTGVCVVAFTGVAQGLGKIQVEEFRHSLRGGGRGAAHHAIFVTDKKRSWYNGGIAAVAARVVNAQLADFGTGRTVTLGNSMGGFGAVVFARRLLGCGTAIAFCPQSSVHPAIAPFETRWRDWRERIGEWDVADAVATLHPGLRYHLFFGTADAQDALHAARFRGAAPGVRVTLIPGCGHDAAAYLKRQRRLRPLLQELIACG